MPSIVSHSEVSAVYIAVPCSDGRLLVPCLRDSFSLVLNS